MGDSVIRSLFFLFTVAVPQSREEKAARDRQKYKFEACCKARGDNLDSGRD